MADSSLQPDQPALNPADIRRLRQLVKWSRNIRITGPYVTMENSAETLAVYVGAPPPTPQRRGGGSFPLGQYQGMFPQMVTDNQLDYDMELMHGLI